MGDKDDSETDKKSCEDYSAENVNKERILLLLKTSGLESIYTHGSVNPWPSLDVCHA